MKLPQEEKSSVEQSGVDQKQDEGEKVVFKIPAQPEMLKKQNPPVPNQHQDYPLQRFIQVALLFICFYVFY